MKVLRYDKIESSKNYGSDADELRRKIVPRLEAMYPCFDNLGRTHADLALCTQLEPILSILDGKLTGKTILDLGCGSNNPYLEGLPKFTDTMFEPWLCRALSLLEIDIIGIDIGPLNGERFKHYQLNLMQPSCLDIIPSSSIDLANAKLLFDSTTLRYHLKAKPSQLMDNLLPQLERVIKPDSHFIHLEI